MLKNAQREMGGLQANILSINLSYAIEKWKFVEIINIGASPAMNYRPTKTKEQIATLICSMEKQFTIHFQPVQVQRGSDDCGIFAITFAESLCSDTNPSFLRYSQGNLRSQLLNCLEGSFFY